MLASRPLNEFAPIFRPDSYSEEDQWCLAPFFTNLDRSVYAPLVFAPELIGALCSRTSRAAQDLRYLYLHEFIYPFLNPVREPKDTETSWQEKRSYGTALKDFIAFLHQHPILEIFSNPRARSFYIKWLAQYGDDSIAQMAGAHLVFWGISQVAIKHLEDQRIGLAPIEKSTRYVNYSEKINGRYLYYTDPTLSDLGVREQYEQAMDGLFETYTRLLPKLSAWLAKRFPEEKATVIEKKAFDTLRGLLPSSALSQVAFFGNGQAFEYLVNRSARHPLGEIRWIAEETYRELNPVTPAFLRRLKDETKQELIEEHQRYLAEKGDRVAPLVEEVWGKEAVEGASKPSVELVEFDPEGETKVVAAMLYSAPNHHRTWNETLARVRQMSGQKRQRIADAYFQGRTQRWQKVGRALENAYVRFEITMNIGAWRDLHRHRMQTQQRQHFSCHHGYDVPAEITEAGLETEFRAAVAPVEDVFATIAHRDPHLAQYATTLAHRIRFFQWKNLRQCFWDIELRSIPEGHPDYRRVEQEQFALLQKVYPMLAERIRVNLGAYDFARRGQDEKIQAKLRELTQNQEP